MTFQATDRDIDGEGAPVATPVSLDSDTLQQWRDELGQFVAHTRLRLQTLSESLTQYQLAQRAIVSEADTMDAVTTEDMTAVTTDLTGSTESESMIEDPAQPMADGDHSDNSPLDRLAAIKLRLAQQIENA